MDRHFEDDLIIIDSRLSTLEEKASSQTMWRRIGIIFSVISIAAHLVTLYVLKKPVEPTACHDSVKTVGTSAFKSKADLSCDHPKHKGTLVSHTSWEMTLQCICQ